jgi:ribosomal protein L11 methyltransferase
LASYPALDVRYVPGPGTAPLEDLLYAELDAFEPLAIQDHESVDGWRVFFRLPSQRDNALRAVSGILGNLVLTVSPVDVDDEDWARRSQVALEAIHVGRITVAPPWDIPSARDSQPVTGSVSTARRDILIVIDPSTGFGTGHHETTRLCLGLLQAIDLRGHRVIDVGTGSGVLALAAWKLGAATVTAIDNDPDALRNARENIARNGAAGIIDVREADLSAASRSIAGPADRADIVLANLTGADLQRHALSLRHLVAGAPVGLLIVSGFSVEELDGVVDALQMPVEQTRREGDWAAAIVRRQ